jgi:hypothetical protein
MESWNCPFCGETVEVKGKLRHTKTGHMAKCSEVKRIKEEVLTKKFLKKEYVNKGKSAKEIAVSLGFVGAKMVIEKLKEHNIPTRNMKESCTKRRKEKTEKTNLKLYGAKHNFSSEHESRKKWEKRLLEEEGITNVFQREDVKTKIVETNIKKYGVESWMQVPENVKKLSEIFYDKYGIHYPVCKAHKKRITLPHKMIIEFLEENGMLPEIEKEIDNGRYYADICINDRIIEVYGDFWHANPRKYKKDDILNFPKGEKRLVSDIWEYDEKRKNFLVEKNFLVLELWEHDIYKNFDTVTEKIWEFLK